jgi:beta-alanine degradation protein BauB
MRGGNDCAHHDFFSAVSSTNRVGAFSKQKNLPVSLCLARNDKADGTICVVRSYLFSAIAMLHQNDRCLVWRLASDDQEKEEVLVAANNMIATAATPRHVVSKKNCSGHHFLIVTVAQQPQVGSILHSPPTVTCVDCCFDDGRPSDLSDLLRDHLFTTASSSSSPSFSSPRNPAAVAAAPAPVDEIYVIAFRQRHSASAALLIVQNNEESSSSSPTAAAATVSIPMTSSSNDSTSSSMIDDDAVTTDVGTRILFQDDSMKVWEFSMAMGEACPVHRHVHPYMFINLRPSTSQLLARDGFTPLGPPVVQRVGQVTYVPLPPSQIAIHSNRNCGETYFCQVIVEFLEP